LSTSPENSLHFLLHQIIRANFVRLHELLAKIGLYQGQPPVIFLLYEHDGLTQKEIGQALNLKPPTVTVMLKRMEVAGFLERRPDSSDMRISRVYLTDKGKKTRLELDNVFKQLEKECFDGFTIEERVLLRRFFIQIRDNLYKVNGGCEPYKG